MPELILLNGPPGIAALSDVLAPGPPRPTDPE